MPKLNLKVSKRAKWSKNSGRVFKPQTYHYYREFICESDPNEKVVVMGHSEKGRKYGYIRVMESTPCGDLMTLYQGSSLFSEIFIFWSIPYLLWNDLKYI